MSSAHTKGSRPLLELPANCLSHLFPGKPQAAAPGAGSTLSCSPCASLPRSPSSGELSHHYFLQEAPSGLVPLFMTSAPSGAFSTYFPKSPI